MPKYLFNPTTVRKARSASQRKGDTGRREAVKKHVDELGGKLEWMISRADVDCSSSSTCPTM